MVTLLYGIGVNDSSEPVTKKVNGKRVWKCPIYTLWISMLHRCYNKLPHNQYLTYVDCSVHEDWQSFSKFKGWVLTQEWEDKQLDKDILFVGNRVYSEHTCAFVSRLTNTFIIDRGNNRGTCKIGVTRYRNKYRAFCSDPFKRYKHYLGDFKSEDEAHEAWLSKKLEYAYEVAAIESDIRVKEAIINRYVNYNKNPDNS